MLLGQQLRGGHQGALEAAPRGQPGSKGRHHGLAGAHVPLHQPVHRRAGGGIRRHLLHHPPLGAGEGEGQQRLKLCQGRAPERRSRRLFPPGTQQRQAAGKGKQLFEDQPPPGLLQRGLALRKVDAAAGAGRAAQAVIPQHLRRQALRRLVRARLHAAQGQSCQQVVGDPFGQGVDRQDAPGEAAALCPLEGRVGHAPGSGAPLHGPVENIILPGAQGVSDIILIKKGDRGRAGVVCDTHLGQGQALADAGKAGRLGHYGPDAHRYPLRGLAELHGPPPVLIGAGIVAQQIPYGPQPQFLQAPLPGRAYPRQFPHAGG